MPFAKRTSAQLVKSKPKYKRRRYGARLNTASASIYLAKKALNQIWQLKGLINSEKKHLDTSGSLTPDWTGTCYPLALMAQGDSISQRNGNSIYARNVHLKGNILNNASASSTTTRLIVFQDNNDPTSSTIPTTADYLATVGNTFSVHAPYNLNNVGRFKTLYDKTFTTSATGTYEREFDINLPMRHHVKFSGSGSTSSDTGKGQIYYILVSTEQTNTPTVDIYTRLSYYDN